MRRPYASGGGGGSSATGVPIAGATAYSVLRVDSAGNLVADSSLLFGSAAAGHGLQVVAGTATTDVAGLSLTQTLNNAGVTFGGALQVDITDTASNAASLAARLRVGGVLKWSVDKTGAITSAALTAGRIPYASTAGLIADSSNLQWDNSNGRLGIGGTPSTQLHVTGSGAKEVRIQSSDNNATTTYYGSGTNRGYVGAISSVLGMFTADVAGFIKLASTGLISVPTTVTAGGTTGNQTINKTSGTVNIAAAGTTVTVTNSQVSASSLVWAFVRTNDTTALIKNVVPGSGSFVINMNAAVTAETSIGFVVFN